MKTLPIKITKLQPNSGQIDGLPKNPRFIKDDKFRKMVKSIQDDPEMLELRECIVFPNKDKFVIIAGDKRYRACLELGYKEMPCKVLPKDYPLEKLKAIVIKDNVHFGEDDLELLEKEWDVDMLLDCGLELDITEHTSEIKDHEVKPFKKTHVLLSFPPDRMAELQELLKAITSKSYVEYEQSSN